jgi:hypothetical protein
MGEISSPSGKKNNESFHKKNNEQSELSSPINALKLFQKESSQQSKSNTNSISPEMKKGGNLI